MTAIIISFIWKKIIKNCFLSIKIWNFFKKLFLKRTNSNNLRVSTKEGIVIVKSFDSVIDFSIENVQLLNLHGFSYTVIKDDNYTNHDTSNSEIQNSKHDNHTNRLAIDKNTKNNSANANNPINESHFTKDSLIEKNEMISDANVGENINYGDFLAESKKYRILVGKHNVISHKKKVYELIARNETVKKHRKTQKKTNRRGGIEERKSRENITRRKKSQRSRKISQQRKRKNKNVHTERFQDKYILFRIISPRFFDISNRAVFDFLFRDLQDYAIIYAALCNYICRFMQLYMPLYTFLYAACK